MKHLVLVSVFLMLFFKFCSLQYIMSVIIIIIIIIICAMFPLHERRHVHVEARIIGLGV